MNAEDLLTFSARAAATGAALWPATVSIGGTEYPATVPEPRVLGVLLDGGDTSAATLIVRILLTDLPAAPTAQQALRWKRPDEAAWRTPAWWIDSVERAPIDAEWRIVCSPKN